jgi:hypothetical protein
VKRVRLVFGTSGSGKSWLFHSFLSEKTPKRLFVIDPMSEHAKPTSERDYSGKRPPWKNSEPLGVRVISPHDAARYLRDHGRGNICRIVLQCVPSIEQIDSLLAAVTDFGGFTVAIEELDLWCTSTIAPVSIVEIIERGQHSDTSILTTSRRPQRVPKTLTAQAGEIWVSGMHEPSDLAYFKAAGLESDKISQLEPRSWIRWESGSSVEIIKT